MSWQDRAKTKLWELFDFLHHLLAALFGQGAKSVGHSHEPECRRATLGETEGDIVSGCYYVPSFFGRLDKVNSLPWPGIQETLLRVYHECNQQDV